MKLQRLQKTPKKGTATVNDLKREIDMVLELMELSLGLYVPFNRQLQTPVFVTMKYKIIRSPSRASEPAYLLITHLPPV